MSCQGIDFIKRCRSIESDRLYIFGRNALAERVAMLIDFRGFVDDFTNESTHLGKDVFRTSILTSESFVINTSTMKPFRASQRIAEYTKNQIHVFSFFEYFGEETLENRYWIDFRRDYQLFKSEYEFFESSLSDEISKATWSNLKHLRLTGEFLDLANFPKSQGVHYFPEFLIFDETQEVFYDIGSFDGETSKDFMNACKTYKKIYAFEPNPKNFATIREKFNGYSCFEIIGLGVSNVNELLGFEQDLGSASHFDKNANLKVQTATLDSLELYPPTFIKMDIEGMERLALEGGENVITKYRPKLAISIYHLFDDVRVISGLIFKMLPNSRVYIRHYSEGTDETVLFCIPN